MARTIGARDAARLAELAAHTRAGGFRGLRARRAWRLLVRACAAGDPAAQDTVRGATADLSAEDALELAAAAPSQPADHAAYLALVGQEAQRRALDPDGSLLALAYRAATPEVRVRLRTVMAAGGDTEVIRVAVTGDRRDRVAEMSYDELDYVVRQFAERGEWPELRRLIRDLPLAKAAAAAGLLPERERAGGPDGLLSTLARQSAGELRSVVDRLPRKQLIEHHAFGGFHRASFSPDSSELALRCTPWWKTDAQELRVMRLRIDSGRATEVFRRGYGWVTKWDFEDDDVILHLGDEILLKQGRRDGYRIVRIRPDHQTLCPPSEVVKMRRSSGGAVLVSPSGLAFADRGARELRYVPVPRLADIYGGGDLRFDMARCALATLPGSRLVAFVGLGAGCLVMDEDGQVLHSMPLSDEAGRASEFFPALSFLSPDRLALHWYDSGFGQDGRLGKADDVVGQFTEVWEFSNGRAPRRTSVHEGAIRNRWPFDTWRGMVLDDSFAARMAGSDRGRTSQGPDPDFPWLPRAFSPNQWSFHGQKLLAMSAGGDMFAVAQQSVPRVEVHSPHLPGARELLEQPLLHSTPQDMWRLRELRPLIGDRAVRDALDLLADCLTERFGADIALGADGRVPSGGPHDIALGPSTDKPQGTV
ncbi:hypothetical protein [Streptomyces sp. NPDC050704]|uniref:hypothetical protein n=1 Tax=Streptomyces sp. NPDC050704 TaxID=3157219 RepID=UPI00341603DA